MKKYKIEFTLTCDDENDEFQDRFEDASMDVLQQIEKGQSKGVITNLDGHKIGSYVKIS